MTLGALHRLRRRTVRRGRVPDHVVVRLSGEITAKNAERVDQSLRNALRTHPRILEVDLHRVSYLASDGARAFLPALRTSRLYDTRVIVTHTSAQARSTLQRLGLTDMLDIHEGGAPDNGGPNSRTS
ncbi:STAS domain-containing protein [Streptomyces sp. CG1]|uniref:STAS domain-containing protein n=1 Tax=Streptomyces sp. CG1 TaxID=1287523 RepID=UPI0034E1BEB5